MLCRNPGDRLLSLLTSQKYRERPCWITFKSSESSNCWGFPNQSLLHVPGQEGFGIRSRYIVNAFQILQVQVVWAQHVYTEEGVVIAVEDVRRQERLHIWDKYVLMLCSKYAVMITDVTAVTFHEHNVWATAGVWASMAVHWIKPPQK